MTGLFGSLNTSTSGLRAQQIGLEITGHNLANSNTVGYSRQRVNTSAAMPQSYAGIGQIGTGVVIDNIVRITDEFVNTQLQNEEASYYRFQEVSDLIGQLEGMFNEPSDSGISHQLSEFFTAWKDVAANPESTTSKSLVISQSETLIETITHTANNMQKLASDTVSEVDKEVLDFNNTVEQLEALNNQIFNATVKGEHPNDLYDKQDLLVGKLKNIGGVEVTKDQYGRSFVKLDGEDVLTANEMHELKVDFDESDNTFNFTVGENDTSVEIKTGRVKGLQEAHEVITTKIADMETFVTKVASAVNTIYSDGNDKNNSFFKFDTDDILGTIKINQELIDDPSKLQIAGDLEKNASGDGARAKAISNLKDVLLSNNPDEWVYNENDMVFENNDSGSKIFDSFNEIVTDIGIIKQRADNMTENQADLAALLSQRQASVSGVDLNEEITNMIQFQSAFQANARVISTVSEMLDTLINRMGV